jgi:hypothetical protein
MNPRRSSLLIIVLALVWVASALNTSSGAIIVCQDDLFAGRANPDLRCLFATELRGYLDSHGVTDSFAGPAWPSSDPPPEGDESPTVEDAPDIVAALPAGCQPSCVSQSTGGGSGHSAIPSTGCRVPEPALVLRLFDETQPSLANPPPGGPLRPPRSFLAG